MDISEKHKLLLCTVVYPQNESYIQQFFRSVYAQDTNEFDFLVVKENVEVNKYIVKNNKINTAVINSSDGTANSNRRQTIEYAIKHNYEYILWQDCDDICHKDRISTVLKSLVNEIDILFHDMSIIDKSGNIIKKSFFDEKVNSDFITVNSLIKKNFLGFGNCVVKCRYLQETDAMKYLDDKVQAVDWWIFTWLLATKCSIKYIDKALSDYRQYSGNVAGLYISSVEQFWKQIDVIKLQYSKLLESNILGEETRRLVNTLMSKINLLSAYDNSTIINLAIENKMNNDNFFLWWEEAINIVEEVTRNGKNNFQK
jgi:hypothetical protein